MRGTVLIVDGDGSQRSRLRSFLASQGYEARQAATLSGARKSLRAQAADAVVLDLHLRDGSGLDLLEELARDPGPPAVIVTSADAGKADVVRSINLGAGHFLDKPVDREELREALRRLVVSPSVGEDGCLGHTESLHDGDNFGIQGESREIENVRKRIRGVAGSEAPVIVLGETGTGKQLVAEAIHRLSPRGAGPFVQANCGQFTESIVESQLFGHEKGAFTGAYEARAGYFEQANGGTLFLDEICEMHRTVQVQLLKVLDRQPFRRVGGCREIWPDARIICASNGDLETVIKVGTFREDLFHRLKEEIIELPPLRERGRDAVLLARYFLERACATLRRDRLTLSPGAEDRILGYGWPGNVRELKHTIQSAARRCRSGTIRPADLGLPVRLRPIQGPTPSPTDPDRHFATLAEVEDAHIRWVLEETGGNKVRAAKLLGIHRDTLSARLRAISSRSRRGKPTPSPGRPTRQ